MNIDKKTKLESSGWTVGTANELLDLSPEESALIELRLRLHLSLSARASGSSP